MKISRRFRSIALLTGLVLALVACGQHAGVHVASAGNGGLVGGAGGPGTGGTGTGGTGTGGTGTGGTGTGGTGTGTGTGGGGTGTGTGGGGGTGTGGGGGTAVGSGDTTGITPTTITIGLHAPLTGAAPIQPSSFQKGKDLFWQYLKNDLHKSVYGRSVNVLFADDGYKPTQAVAVCNQMASQGHAFLLIGGAGADQINACAQYANQYGIPYMSPGVQETGLSSLKNYFAVTMTYAGQMPLLVQMLQAKNKKASLDKYGLGGGAKDGKITVGFVRPNTGAFDDASAALKQAVTKAGWQFKQYTVQKEGTSTDAQSVATSARSDGIDILVPITAPNFTVLLASQLDTYNYNPQWAGVAITDNLNQFLQNVQSCGQHQGSTVNGALWLSPWPAWASISKYDPDFTKAANKYAPDVNTADNGGDLLLALWGISKGLYQMFLKAGPKMSRQSFMQTLSTFSYSSGTFPDLRFGGSPFGAHGAFLLKASCTTNPSQFLEDTDFRGLHQSF